MNAGPQEPPADSAIEPEAGLSWAERAALDPLAAVLDPGDRSGARNRLIDRMQRAALRPALQSGARGLRVLDFGCGTGRMTAWLAQLGHDPEGVDPVPEMIDAARAQHPGLNFACAGGAALPQQDASFDVVLTVGVLLYVVGDPDRMGPQLAELRRVLRPGGRLLALEQVHNGELDRAGTVEQYRGQFDAAGFDVTSAKPVRFSDSRVLAHVTARPWLARLPGAARLAWSEARRRDPRTLPPEQYYDVLFDARRRP